MDRIVLPLSMPVLLADGPSLTSLESTMPLFPSWKLLAVPGSRRFDFLGMIYTNHGHGRVEIYSNADWGGVVDGSTFTVSPGTNPQATLLMLGCPYFHISSNVGLLPFRRQGLEPYCERDASRARLLEMRLFGEAKSISGHQTLQLMRRPYGVKRNVYVVTLPAFQRCLEDGPDVAEQRPGSGFSTGRGIGDGHLKAHHDLQATPARPGKATRLGVRGSIVPAASRTSYSSFWKVRGRDLYSSTEKKGADYFLLNDIRRSRQFPNGVRDAQLKISPKVLLKKKVKERTCSSDVKNSSNNYELDIFKKLLLNPWAGKREPGELKDLSSPRKRKQK
ncbi:hypothetical protein FXO37_00889 [Capsicum annuum]|nr:hypothetical protein FXO37_00889 [Capsicum annuum]